MVKIISRNEALLLNLEGGSTLFRILNARGRERVQEFVDACGLSAEDIEAIHYVIADRLVNDEIEVSTISVEVSGEWNQIGSSKILILEDHHYEWAVAVSVNKQ